ncbi:MAG: adenylate/guanylate cyclase domain-containing protein [Roseiarcus sp.]|uniref:adenylate/guanylate cyclase domain-containing protein n=1 Tax=Roseiarcus sp. TaxID=1969460 RepID=UPI003BAE2BE1
MDIGRWLRSLGLAQYEAAFRDNEIDGDVLPKLTVEDLKDLGVAVVGHRRKIMSAIETLNAPAAALAEAAHSPATQTSVPAADAAERRQLTVMFSDLVGSTALSARLDPEDMRQVIRACQDACSGVVARYDGFVAKFMGDGVLAYFGFPRAHEDDAARAVHAGLEIAEAVAALQTRARDKLAVRVGIATGLVVVGDLVGRGPAREQAVVGDTPNLAARLQGLAEAGGVVISSATRRLIGDRFRLNDLGRHAVKGLAEPVEAYAALGVSPSESRFEAAHSARLLGFVGREAESADLLARLRRAWQGQGQIVLISGDAGIGKSRLAAWLAEQVTETPHTRLRYQCSPYHRDSALYPFVQQLERGAGIAPQEAAEAKLEKLEKMLSLGTDRMNEVAPLIASLLSIPTGTRYPALNLSPPQQRRQTLSALLDQIEGLAKKQPVLVLFEDAHWADATSLEVLDLAIERVRRLPVLFLITFRPEFEAPWSGSPDVETITLGRLDRAEAERLVESVTGGRKLPAEVLAQVVAKTDGVPLFVEELTKNVLESGLLVEEADRFRLDGPLPPLAIPSTLQDSLMARLDRLAAVKEIAQIGAAIGREFSYPLLNAVVGRDEPTLRAALAQLEDSELVFRSGDPPAARYIFKHALVQDTAYESLLKSRRQILHQKIAETLREKFADVVEAEPELLARHFTQAGLTASAIEYWGKAGDLALRRSAFKEAIAHLGKAIEMTEALTASAEKTSGRLRLHVSFGNAMIAAHGHGAPETAAAFRDASELGAGAADLNARFSINYGLWAAAHVHGDLAGMREPALAFLRDVEQKPHSPEAGVAHRIYGATQWFAGDFVEGGSHLEKALAIFDPEQDRDLAFRFGQDVGVSATVYLAIVLWPLGEVDRARELVDAAARRIANLGHLATSTFGLMHSAMFEIIGRNVVRAAPLAKALSSVAHEHGISLWICFGAFLEAWVDSQSGSPQTGLLKMRRANALLEQERIRAFQPLVKTALAEAEVRNGETEAALATIERALEDFDRSGQRWFDAETYRVRGEILLKQNPSNPTPAEESFLTAVAISQAQKARGFELRSALSLARLYQSTGRDADAHDVLGPALERFSPTPEFPEIAEAKALFDALAEADSVKAAMSSRARQVQLQIALGNALIATRGHGALETTAAFAKARDLARGIDDNATRASITYGLWVGSYTRGELEPMLELAAAFLRDTASCPNSAEAAVAERINGVTRWFQGDFVGARAHFERALAIFDRIQDRELAFRFGQDQLVANEILLALVLWPLGKVDDAGRLARAAQRHAEESGQVSTAAYLHMWAGAYEILRDDAVGAALHIEALDALSREHDLAFFAELGSFFRGWLQWRVGDGEEWIREGLATFRDLRSGARARLAVVDVAFARGKGQIGGLDAALAILDDIVTNNERIGQRWLEAEHHRARGELLAEADPSAAENALLRAIAIAQAQKARSFELRAALSLAKLYRATSRDAEAHDVLGPALEGFSPTPEFPEIAEAQAFMAASRS